MAKITAKSIINFAIKIERGGEIFYNTVAGKIRDEEISDLFKLLSAEETRHKQDFKEIGKKMFGFGKADLVEVITKENSIINAIVSSLIQKSSEKISEYSKRIKNKVEVIEVAIGFEKDTILFYYEIMDLMKDEESQKVLNRIITEERRHILRLMNLKKKFLS
jgi:rubrerythrin